MKKIVRLFLLGLITWLVPFVAAFFFMDRNGALSVDIFLFKTIMIIVGAITGAFAIAIYFKKVNSGYLKQGIVVGLSWLAMNIVLDLLILIPMSKMSYPDYFMQIGLRYTVLAIFCILIGYLLELKTAKS
jgi:hypothetical protein